MLPNTWENLRKWLLPVAVVHQEMGIIPNFWTSGPTTDPFSRNLPTLENQCSFLMLKGNTFNTEAASVGSKT